ncbi:phosphoserine transaminase [Mastigocoleus testarum]|uniref:phosphoserine transaminase n=1 Tax=Mastigocoleus testarum BC008 TaxID=371196 RepID=A0A0V7ZY52_9CYAN|nr:phosphoserine transaminase [Mastigocoleus testarum]KST69378.1 phosphoserine aminotransferase [Mastigocoleus testarum BC008]
MQTQDIIAQKPTIRPQNPNFSSGPCSKRPGWSLENLKDATLGRSHRSKLGKGKLHQVIELSKEILQVPSDYRLGIVPASDTGAFEMAMWTMLGERGVDVLAWESFSQGWLTDVVKQLKLQDVNAYKADYGQIPELGVVNTDRDVVFAWNGTTSGVRVPNGDWIKDDRQGLTLCDATSAVYAMDIPWHKIDVLTYSWQKVMGGEAAHGVIVLSPRAVARLESYTPDRPLPKIFRLTKGGKLIEGIFQGSTINTPSMLCVEDALDGLNWAKSIGGLNSLIERSQKNLQVLESWVAKTDWIDFLVADKSIRSNTSICLIIVDSWYKSLSKEEQAAKAKELVSLMDKEGVAYDIGAYRDAPSGLRIWGGATVDSKDMEALTQWLNWGFATIKKNG